MNATKNVLCLVPCAMCLALGAADGAAVFTGFAYEGRDVRSLNPVLPGMAPDPSVTRKGEWFYLAQSSFSTFPGIPVWRSRNLVDWEFVRYALDRPAQLPLAPGLGLSAGVFAPDIKYNPYNDTFYLLVTLVGAGGNVLYKTRDPALGWSDPVALGFGGIDPGIYFEDATTAYIVNNDDAPGNAPEYDGHRTIRCRPYDLTTDTCHNEQEVILVNKGIHPEERPIWCEGPHLYKVRSEELAVSSCFDSGKQANASQKTTNSSLLTPNYYLMTAEGGTGGNHSEVIWRGPSPMGPFTPCPVNPILTQRDLPGDRPNPVTAAGHADLVQAPDGQWWAVFLGIVPYRSAAGRTYCNTGRSTFLLPVKWIGEGDARQPLILEAGREIPAAFTGAPRPVPAAPWFWLRGATNDWAEVAADTVRITPRPDPLSRTGYPSCLCRWVRDRHFTATVALDFAPTGRGDFAGLVYHQDERHYYALGRDATGRIVLIKRHCGEEWELGALPLPPGTVHLRITSDDAVVRFFASPDGAAWTQLGGDEDATILSTDHCGGFVGALLGLYAVRPL